MKDVGHLLDYYGIQEFVVHDVSGGSPYALAAAYYFDKSRLKKTSIMCGVAHPRFEAASVSMEQRSERWLTSWVPFYKRPYAFGARRDQAVIEAKGNQREADFIDAKYHEMQRRGSDGFNNDFKLVGRPWEFELEDIDANHIRWYHGSLDVNTSSDAARATMSVINHSRKNFIEVPGKDHYGVQAEKFRESMEWLLK
jgi:hypothetical protein